MRGLRLTITILAFTLLAATAAAAPGVPAASPAEDAPALPTAAADALADAGAATASAAGALADGAAAAAGALADAARAVGAAVAAVARAVAHAVVAVVDGVVTGLTLVWSGLVALVQAVGSAVAAVGRAIAWTASALASLAVAGVQALAAAVTAVAGLVVAVVTGVAGLVTGAAAWFLALDGREQAVVAASGAGATGAAGGLAWWLKRAGVLGALPLYSRLAPSDMLKNAVRARIFEHIRANPGAHPSGLVDALDLGWGTTVYHLSRLEDARLVRAEKRGAAKCYFAVGEVSVTAQKQLSALRNDTARHVAEFIAGHPSASQKDVGRALGLSAALVSWHVKKLAASDVLRVEKSGRTNVLFLADGVPLAAAAQAAKPAAPAPALHA